MKAVLAIHGVEFPRTHDPGFLLELADRDGVRIPDVTDGSCFRNTEVLTFDGDKLARAEVYFGWDVPAA